MQLSAARFMALAVYPRQAHTRKIKRFGGRGQDCAGQNSSKVQSGDHRAAVREGSRVASALGVDVWKPFRRAATTASPDLGGKVLHRPAFRRR